MQWSHATLATCGNIRFWHKKDLVRKHAPYFHPSHLVFSVYKKLRIKVSLCFALYKARFIRLIKNVIHVIHFVHTRWRVDKGNKNQINPTMIQSKLFGLASHVRSLTWWNFVTGILWWFLQQLLQSLTEHWRQKPAAATPGHTLQSSEPPRRSAASARQASVSSLG